MTAQQPAFAEVQPSSFPQVMEQPVSTEENNWMVNAVPQQEVQHYPSHQNYYDYQSYPVDSSPESTAPPSSFPNTVQQQTSYYNDPNIYYHSNNNSATATYSYDPNYYFNDYCYPSQTYCWKCLSGFNDDDLESNTSVQFSKKKERVLIKYHSLTIKRTD